jgi:hypothetical protein
MRKVSAFLAVLILMSVLGGVSLAGPPAPETEGPVPAGLSQGPYTEGRAVQAGGLLYMTSIDCHIGTFAVYDPASDSWTPLNDFHTHAQMAVSAAGELFALNCESQTVEVYDPGTDSWSYVMDGPPVAYLKGNLEVHNIGEFLYSEGDDPNLYWSTGGTWYSMPLLFSPNVMGDYDPTTDQYVIGEKNTTNAYLIDAFGGWSVTAYNSAVPGGEWARVSSILDGRYYWQTSNTNFHSFDLSLPGDPPTDHGVTWGYYNSSAADRDNGIIYVAELDGANLIAYDPATNGITPLTGYASDIWHSSLAFVPEVPIEPKVFVQMILMRIIEPQPDRFIIQALVRIMDEDMNPIPGATVDAEWLRPVGPWIPQTRTTRPNGIAVFMMRAVPQGYYDFCVTNVQAAGYQYDAGMNWETCDAILFP